MQNLHALRDRLRNTVHLLDGGLATELERWGHDITGKLWSGHVLIEHPDAIEQVHFHYLCAGADVIITASYQISTQGLVEAGYGADAGQQLLNRSVTLAEGARARFVATTNLSAQPLIAASVGPYGAYLADGSEYHGNYGLSENELQAFHRERLSVLASSGADVIAFETIPSITEARALARLAAEYADLSAWLSFSCRDGQHLNDGTHIRDAANAVLDIYPNLLATGVNCTAPRHIESLLDALASDLDVVLLAYPNSGEGWNAATRTWEGENDPYSFADYADRWVAAGARLIGGCGRTGVEHVERLRAARTR